MSVISPLIGAFVEPNIDRLIHGDTGDAVPLSYCADGIDSLRCVVG